MYAIIKDGEHQYRVQEGDLLEVERRDIPEGQAKVEFDRVLLIGDLESGAKVGAPNVMGARVTASVLGEVKGEKLIIQKFRRRKNYALRQGHRQKYLQVKIDKIHV